MIADGVFASMLGGWNLWPFGKNMLSMTTILYKPLNLMLNYLTNHGVQIKKVPAPTCTRWKLRRHAISSSLLLLSLLIQFFLTAADPAPATDLKTPGPNTLRTVLNQPLDRFALGITVRAFSGQLLIQNWNELQNQVVEVFGTSLQTIEELISAAQKQPKDGDAILALERLITLRGTVKNGLDVSYIYTSFEEKEGRTRCTRKANLTRDQYLIICQEIRDDPTSPKTVYLGMPGLEFAASVETYIRQLIGKPLMNPPRTS